MRKFTCYFHGTAQPNPGIIGLGVVVFDQNGVEIITASVKGGKGTNNIGAYKALILAFELCLKGGIDGVSIFGDSQVVINQVNGLWVVTNENLLPFQAKAQEFGDQLHCDLNWIKKAENKRACELSLLAIGASSDTISFSHNQQGFDKASKEDIVEHDLLDELAGGNVGGIIHDVPERFDSSSNPGADAKPNHVFVKGLRGGKVAFVYGHDVVIFDLISNHCTCIQFKVDGSCLHAEAIDRAGRNKAS